jgi:hypothetical protein
MWTYLTGRRTNRHEIAASSRAPGAEIARKANQNAKRKIMEVIAAARRFRHFDLCTLILLFFVAGAVACDGKRQFR